MGPDFTSFRITGYLTLAQLHSALNAFKPEVRVYRAPASLVFKRISGSGGRTRTDGLRVMSPPRCLCATPQQTKSIPQLSAPKTVNLLTMVLRVLYLLKAVDSEQTDSSPLSASPR